MYILSSLRTTSLLSVWTKLLVWLYTTQFKIELYIVIVLYCSVFYKTLKIVHALSVVDGVLRSRGLPPVVDYTGRPGGFARKGHVFQAVFIRKGRIFTTASVTWTLVAPVLNFTELVEKKFDEQTSNDHDKFWYLVHKKYSWGENVKHSFRRKRIC